VGLENVRQRLSQMCGGDLTIESAPGEGTRVTIALPKEANQR
jgi:sensor histidine kinase YesM